MTSQNNLKEPLRSTEEECERLRAENAGLRAMLGIQNSTSRERLDYLAGRLHGACSHIFILKGGMGAKQRRKLTESLAAVPLDEPRVILATGSYLGEGFDDARIDTLFLAMPISWRGTLQQYVGRLHRLHDNKKEVQVYDYADVFVPMLARMYKRRLAGYAAFGYTVGNELKI
jgi:superfamily II DNA or RNA helicase